MKILPIIFDKLSICRFDRYRKRSIRDHWLILLVVDVIVNLVSKNMYQLTSDKRKKEVIGTSSSAFRTRLITSSSSSINFIIL